MFPTCLPDFRRCCGAQQQSWRWQFGRTCTHAHLHMLACTSARMINRLLCESFKILLTETLSKCVSVERMSRGFSWMEMACSFQDISWRCTMPRSLSTHTHAHTHKRAHLKRTYCNLPWKSSSPRPVTQFPQDNQVGELIVITVKLHGNL